MLQLFEFVLTPQASGKRESHNLIIQLYFHVRSHLAHLMNLSRWGLPTTIYLVPIAGAFR